MSIHFEIPELEADLRAGYGNLESAAKDALLIDAYRTGRISIGRLAETLHRSVSSTIEWLESHRVAPNFDGDDLAADARMPGGQDSAR